MSEAFIGELRIFGFNFAPYGWAVANGQILPLSQNTALFSLLGTNFGGDGKSTFGLPNLTNNVAVGAGMSAWGTMYEVGDAGGSAAVALSTADIPAHTHSFGGESFRVNAITNVPSPKTTYANAVKCQPFLIDTTTPPPTMAAMAPTAIGVSGSSFPHDNIMPSLVLNFCICMQGTYPPRP
jgi:microcystin-dependent protein